MASIMRFDEWKNTVGNGTTRLDSAGRLYAPGYICQTVHTNTGNATSISGGQFIAYNGLDTTVTPKFENSKFLIRYQLNIGNYAGSTRVILKVNGSYQNTYSTDDYRASSNSFYGSSALPQSANIVGYTGEYLFSNTGTNNVAVSFEIFRQDTAYAALVNRSYSYDDTARGRPTSWVTIQEIAQ